MATVGNVKFGVTEMEGSMLVSGPRKSRRDLTTDVMRLQEQVSVLCTNVANLQREIRLLKGISDEEHARQVEEARVKGLM